MLQINNLLFSKLHINIYLEKWMEAWNTGWKMSLVGYILWNWIL